MRLSLQDVVGATRGVSKGAVAVHFTSFHTDSREVMSGGLFFALKGAERDGHEYLAAAVEGGAAGVVVDRAADLPPAVAMIQVEDTWAALYDLARMVKERVRPVTFGVTGSNGKTSTKEFLAAVLELHCPVLKTEGNLNTETGVPLTVLRL